MNERWVVVWDMFIFGLLFHNKLNSTKLILIYGQHISHINTFLFYCTTKKRIKKIMVSAIIALDPI
jgi:hypothetical protein